MPRNNSAQLVIDRRRRIVASSRLRQLTQREIVKELEEQGVLNPKTEEPYDLATVNRDIKAMEAEWKESAAGDMAQHKGNHIAELREVRREAWKGEKGKPKLFYVLKALEQEARVLGLEENAGEDVAEKARVYLDLLDKARQDAEDLSE